MIGVQHIDVGGQRFVLLPQSEYERLCAKQNRAMATVDDDLPALPEADKNGRFPAIEYVRITLARGLIRDRRAAGMTQERLAKLAGVRQETISRLESGKHSATPRTVDKIDRVLQKALRSKPTATGRR